MEGMWILVSNSCRSLPTLNRKVFCCRSLSAISLPGYCKLLTSPPLFLHDLVMFFVNVFLFSICEICLVFFTVLKISFLRFMSDKQLPLVSSSLPHSVSMQNGLGVLFIFYYQIVISYYSLPMKCQQSTRQSLLSAQYWQHKVSNQYNISLTYQILMKICILLLAELLRMSLQAVAGPTWSVNTLINSGEHKAINGVSTAPSTVATSQTFNTSFATAPRVVLSLEGYKQNSPCSGCQVGFKYQINSISATGFTGSVTVYGANIFYLLYTYMGVSNLATEYFTSYQLLSFSSGNLVDTASASRSLTQVFNNQAGQSFPNYPTNTITSTIFLAGFKTNLGTTGTYINLTSRVESSSTHSVTIGTRGDAQIFQIGYFRISFDKTAITQGYVNFIDSLYIWGANSTQQTTTSSLPAGAFMYRNYMMGFNQISLASTSQASDIMLQFYTTPQVIWASSSVVQNFVNTNYEYLWADIFHHRRRNCAASTPYYNYQDQLCYDVCPTKTFAVEATKYCQQCHYSCTTCVGTLPTNCSTCSAAVQFRQIVVNTSSCACLGGYFENNTAVCAACAAPCITCVTSAANCLSCDSANHHRNLNATSNLCVCVGGFYETSANTPVICLACDPTCVTCLSSAAFCLSCNAAHNRSLNASSNVCQCVGGYYQTSANTPVVCLACDPNCLTCATTATNCLSCRVGFYLDSVNNTGCQPCSIVGCTDCVIGSGRETCTVCNTTQGFTLANSTVTLSICTCPPGQFPSASGCTACNYQCTTCSLSTSCDTCNLATHHRQLNSNISALCPCIAGYFDNGSNSTCLQCDAKCLTCATISTNCLTCDTSRRFHSTVNSTGVCSCNNGTQESGTTYGQCISIPTVSVCGNGIIQSPQQCDDYNTNSNDGCSPQCRVQGNHICEQYSNGNGTSLCYYNKPLTMAIQSVIKLINDNKIAITIKIEALLCNLGKLKEYLDSLVAIELAAARRILAGSTIIYISSANFVITDQTNYQGYLNLVLEYTESISTLQNRQLSFLSSNVEQSTLSKSYFFATPTSNIVLQDPYNKIPMNFYPTTSYQATLALSYVFLALIALNFLFFLVLVFLRKSVVPVESLLIFQFAYFCVAGQKEVELAVASLAFFGKYSLGLNINFIKSVVLKDNENYQICSKMGDIYQQCNSLNNINITFYLAIALFLFYIGCCVYKFKKQRDLDKKEEQPVQGEVEMTAQGRVNSGQQNGQLREAQQSQTGSKESNQSSERIMYELPAKIRAASMICLQFSMGMFFLTAIEYFMTAFNQGDLYKMISIVWLAIVGAFFVGLWVVYFYSYPLEELSYVHVLKRKLEKLSVQKFAYFGLFVFLLLWGVVLAMAPGIGAYSLLIVWSLLWAFLTVRRQIYQSGIHKLRGCINQIITLAIAIIFILLQYAPSDGLGLGYSIVLLILLVGSFINNLLVSLYGEYLERRNKKLGQDQSQFRQAEDEFKNYSSRKSDSNEIDHSDRKNPHLKLFEMTTPKRQALIDNTQMKETARSKANQLKNFKKLLKIQNKLLADEKKVELLSSLRKIEGQPKLEESSQYRGL